MLDYLLNRPILLTNPQLLAWPPNWHEHIPFAMTLVDLLRPSIIVELGTHSGSSYCAFCQAVQELGLPTRCYAIDTWEGDDQASRYGPEVLADLRAYHDPHYGSFSQLIQSTFDEGVSHFNDRSIDLLHIDGLHTYEAVKHDFTNWLPKMSSRGIVLLHDIEVRERNFGVWRLWEELRETYPVFEFMHGHGLGVVAVGEMIPDELRFLFEADDATRRRIRALFHRLGSGPRFAQETKLLHEHVSQLTTLVGQLNNNLAERDTRVHHSNLRIAELESLVTHSTNVITEQEQRIQDHVAALQIQQVLAEELQQQLTLQQHEVGALRQREMNHRNEVESLQQRIEAQQRELDLQQQEVQFLQNELYAIQIGLGYKMLKRVRNAWSRVIPEHSNRRRMYHAIRRSVSILRYQGKRAFIRELLFGQSSKIHSSDETRAPVRQVFSSDPVYNEWIEMNTPDTRQLQQQREIAQSLINQPLISIITPCYNIDGDLLKQCIESVLAQSYPFWELCLVDDHSTLEHVRPILQQYAEDDSRIRVKFAKENSGIASATNQCLALANGEFVAFLDNDDILAPYALFSVVEVLQQYKDVEMIYSDEDKIGASGLREQPHFKPNFSLDLLRSHNYICHFLVLRRHLVQELGGLREGYDGAQDYDLIVRAVERIMPKQIIHIADILYHWRIIAGSTAANYHSKPDARRASLRLIDEHLQRTFGDGYGYVEPGRIPGVMRVHYALISQPLVSLIICTRDGLHLLRRCIASFENSTYKHYEIIIVDNGSTDPKTLAYFDDITASNSRVRVIACPEPFNYSRLNNIGVAQAQGDVFVLLNNDIEVLTPTWIETMLGLAQQTRVGVVGARLLYPNGTIQHAGIILGLGGIAGHGHRHAAEHAPGYFGTLVSVRNYSAVTGACLMCRRDVWERVGGLDEQLAVLFNDVDFCLRVREQGYDVVATPDAILWHHESASIGRVEQKARTIDVREVHMMQQRWSDAIINDPFYNPNLTLVSEDFAIETAPRRFANVATQYSGQRRVIPETSQLLTDVPIGEIWGNLDVRQSFRVESDGFVALELMPATYGRQNIGKVYIALIDDIGEILADWHLPAGSIQNNMWQRFSFQPIEHSGNRTFTICIAAPTMSPGNAITLWMTKSATEHAHGDLRYGGELVDGTLAIRAFVLKHN